MEDNRGYDGSILMADVNTMGAAQENNCCRKGKENGAMSPLIEGLVDVCEGLRKTIPKF